MAAFAFVLFACSVVFAILPGHRTPLGLVGVSLVAATFAVLGLPPLVEWSLVAGLTTGSALILYAAKRLTDAAYKARNQKAVARWGRLGLLLNGHPQWANVVEMGTWREMVTNDWVAARPVLDRVASRPGPVQPFYALLREAAYGHVDVASLVELRWSTAPRRLRPLLLHLAITELVEEGRTAEALSMLGRGRPNDLTSTVRPLVLAEIASAIGDRETLEGILAQGHRSIDGEGAEIYRAVADRARGDTKSGDQRLRSIEVPTAGRTARQVAKRLEHPVPIFDESNLDAAPRCGLELYRRLAQS